MSDSPDQERAHTEEPAEGDLGSDSTDIRQRAQDAAEGEDSAEEYSGGGSAGAADS
ncbi:hypothetical protein [uncultured Arthrobacter sp.]|uniref:hypothetical protein n=1 Tax=uncultured Arthrobacter sp. TaxID=114050 RepID=UPI0025D726B2|nr:hypothetical protein [uncultured Arthrobacter sp.]